MPAVSQDVLLRGRGIHSGVDSTVRIRKRDDESGLRFFWPGWSQPLSPKDLGSLRRQSKRATILEGRPGQIFRTPEHLLAACLFFADQPLDVHCDAQEPPGLDGSAQPYYQALTEAAGSIIPRWRDYASRLEWKYDGPEGAMIAMPASSFSVEYEWEQSSAKQHCILNFPDKAVREILPARTFIAYRDWMEMKRQPGLLSGAGADSGLLLAGSAVEFDAARQQHLEFKGRVFPLLHPENFRMKDEPVKHKILDLLGDLALRGLALPRLRLKIRNGGHALNHLLLEQLA